MKKYLAYALSVLLIATGIFILAYTLTILKPQGQGALQVIANVKSSVTLDGKSLGDTPVCKCNQNDTITEGTYTLVVTPYDKTLEPFSEKLDIATGVLTAVERTFLPGSLASAYTLNLEKTSSQNPELIVTSIPIDALVTVDGNQVGATPYEQDNISASEHELIVQKAGYGKKTIQIRTVPNYKLTASVILGTGEDTPDLSTQAGPSPTPAGQTPTPTGSGQAASPSAVVKILQTPTGFLRVRSEPSLDGTEIGQATPGQTYPYVGEQTGWLEINFNNQNGWVSDSYAEKTTE